MTHIKTLLFLIVLSLQGTASVAAAAQLSASYLEGRWSMGGKEGCSADHDLYVIFHRNGTLEAGRGELVRAVGFWELGDAAVNLHLLVTPSSAAAQHPFYQSRYYYQYMSPKILAMRADSFNYTSDGGTEAGKQKTLTRCQ